jgi:HlyD family secretion protein
VLAVLLLIAGVVIVLVRRGGARSALTAAGTVEATEAQLGFQAAGRILDVLVEEGDTVHRGQELAHLDTLETSARRRQAAAQVAAARALLLELERGARPQEVIEARAARDAAADKQADARRDLDRARRLRADGLVSQETLDKITTASQVAESQRAQAEAQFRLVVAGPRSERIAAQRAQVAQAEAAVAALDATLANMTIRAPFGGMVTVKARQPGETVAAGSPVVTILDRDDRWVRIYVPETRLGAVRLGADAAVTSDTPPRTRYAGTVVYVSPEAEFTPKSVQTQEERVKLVYAVKVRITGDPGYELKPGMPADVRLETAAR